MRSAPSKQNDYLSEQIKENIKQSKINEHETPFDEILYDLFSVGESVDKQSRALTRKSRTKLLYLFSTYGRTFVFYMFISVDILSITWQSAQIILFFIEQKT